MVLDLMMARLLLNPLFLYLIHLDRLFLYQNLSSSKAIVFLYIYSSIIYLFIILCTDMHSCYAYYSLVEAQNAPAWQIITVVKSWASFLGHSS